MSEALHEGLPYEHRVLRHVARQGFPAGSTAVDVGASFGNHSLWLAVVCGLSVMAVEPLDYERLRENLRLNPDADVTVWPIGLGEETRRGPVTGPPEHMTGPVPDRETVPIEKLDDLGARNVSLIKIDVEGMEPEVLSGARQTIERDRPRLYVEAQDAAAGDRNAAEIPFGYEHTGTWGATPLEEWTWRG